MMSLVLLCAKLYVIYRFASIVPYWDQWETDGLRLFDPYLDGGLELSELFTTQNEHSMFFTRIISLFLLEVTGFWDTISQVVVNAVLHVIGLTVFVHCMIKPLGGMSARILIFVFTVLLALPIGWANAMNGMQSQVFLVVLFSTISLKWCIESTTLSKEWFVGFFFGLCAFFNQANGLMVFPVIFLFSAIRLIFNTEDRRRAAIGCLISVLSFAMLFALVPVIEKHNVLKAQSLVGFMDSLSKLLSWPLYKWHFHALVIWAPTAALAWHLFRKGFPKEDRSMLPLALSIWVFVLEVIFAYGRGVDSLNARYLDLIILGLVTNTAISFILLERMAAVSARRILILAISGMMLWLGLWTSKWVDKGLRSLAKWHYNGQKQTENVRGYMITGDSTHLFAPAKSYVPYRPGLLAEYLKVDDIRGTLPAELGSTASERKSSVGKTMLKGRLSASAIRMRDAMLGYSLPLLVVFGLLHFALLMLSAARSVISSDTFPVYWRKRAHRNGESERL